MDFFTPREKKDAIAKRVEADLGSMLEDLAAAVWIVYTATRDDPKGEMHQFALGVITSFGLHQFGWQRSKMIPGRLVLEGADATLDERIDQYCSLARAHEDQIRPNLVIMLGFVYHMCRNNPDDVLHVWVRGAMARHDIPADCFTESPLHAHFVAPDSDRVQ